MASSLPAVVATFIFGHEAEKPHATLELEGKMLTHVEFRYSIRMQMQVLASAATVLQKALRNVAMGRGQFPFTAINAAGPQDNDDRPPGSLTGQA
jgi:hypothetical protein